MEHDLHLNETEVQYNRIKVSNILIEFYRIPSSANGTALIFCYGIPSHPFDRFPFGLESYLRQGYLLAYPHYEGTFGSDGVCTIENAVDSTIQAVQAVLQGSAIDLLSGKHVHTESQQIILVGGSFGGSVALLAAAKSSEINTVISVAGPTNYRGRDFSSLEAKMNRAYKKEWNIDSSVWEAFKQERLDINPIDYVDALKQKNTYLIHGAHDPIVSADHATTLHDLLKVGSGNHQLLIEPNVEHIGSHYIGIERVHHLVENWLKSSLSL